jgi:hypothetical protein
MEWQELTEFPGTGQVKYLRSREPGSGSTMMVRLPAGGQINPHSHVKVVQHYILEGECETDGKVYGAGTYRLFPAQADIPDITTQNGVTILMIYDPID